jgi:hypothetical protein
LFAHQVLRNSSGFAIFTGILRASFFGEQVEHSYAPIKIEIDHVYVDEIVIARLKLTKDLLRQIGTLPATLIEGDEQDLIACCDKLIAYYSPIQESRLRKRLKEEIVPDTWTSLENLQLCLEHHPV